MNPLRIFRALVRCYKYVTRPESAEEQALNQIFHM